jgi:hypothetical protein
VDSAKEILALIHDPRDKIQPLCYLAIAQLQANDPAGAKQSCQSLKTEWTKIEAKERDDFVPPVAHALARVVGFAEARAMVDAAVKEDFRGPAYAEIVRGLAENGNLQSARALADVMDVTANGQEEPPAHAYQSIAAAQIKARDFSGARITAGKTDRLRDKAWPNSFQFKGSILATGHAEILADIAAAELAAGKTADAVKDLAAARDSLKSNKAISATVYGKVAALQIRAGQTAEAFAMIKGSSADAQERCSAYAYAARNLAPDPEVNWNASGPTSK